MAKRMRSGKRGASATTNRYHRLPSPPLYRLRPISLSVFGDRRAYHPEPVRLRPALSVRRMSDSDVVLKRPSRPFRFPDHFGFRVPNYVAICMRRAVRKEVIHALDLTRKGAGGAKRRNEWSNVKC